MLARVAGATHSGEKRPDRRRHHQDNASHCPRKTEDGRASRREVMHDSCITTQRRVSLRLCQCNLFSGKDRPRMQCILYALGITWCFQVGKHCSETSGTLYCSHPCHPYTTRNVAPLLSLVAQASRCHGRPGPFYGVTSASFIPR